jgi:hypothetical protein
MPKHTSPSRGETLVSVVSKFRCSAATSLAATYPTADAVGYRSFAAPRLWAYTKVCAANKQFSLIRRRL